MADTSDKMVKRQQVQALRSFERALRTRTDTRLQQMRTELAQVVNVHGINSLAYDNYLLAIKAFLEA